MNLPHVHSHNSNYRKGRPGEQGFFLSTSCRNETSAQWFSSKKFELEYTSNFLYKQFFWILRPFHQNEIFVITTETWHSLHKANPMPKSIKQTACKYNIDPNQIHRWKNSLSGLNEEDGQHQLALLTSFKDQAKKTLHCGKLCIDNTHYRAIRHLFDTLHSVSWHVSVMMLGVELKKLSETPV